ncbi:MAG: NAD(P)-dependent oxidoreductase [Desulfuromonas sp.]|nr:MAG: NAD(P)-dependent oxidoreductase [Desulfuromonas sp.]
MKIGFIGLGHLGRAMAERLTECGHELIVWNRSADRTEGLTASVAISPAALAEDCDIIFLCLFDSDAVRSILLDEKGVLSVDMAGKVIIDVTTNHYREVVSFHDLCRQKGTSYLEAPVIGSVVPAQKGMLTILASGNEKTYQQVRPLLENLGENLFFLEEPGTASKMKVINNMALGSIMAANAEALAMAEKAGIDVVDALEILSVGGGSSRILTAKKKKLLENDFTTHFSSALLYKDLACLMDLASEEKKSLLISALIKELYGRTFEEGFASEDFSAIYKLFRGAIKEPALIA